MRAAALLAGALVAGLILGAAAAAARASGRSAHVEYMLHCQGCHLPDGTGSPGEVPSLENVGRFLLVPGGRAYLVQVPGSSLSPLGDAELASVLNWILTSFGPEGLDAAPYTAEEVGTLRANPLTRVESVRGALLEEIARRRTP